MSFREHSFGNGSGDVPRELQPSEVWLLLTTVGVSAFNDMRKQHPEQPVDLSDENVTGFNLVRANFNAANLSETYFRDCNLSDADFRGANLRDARFENCILQGAQFDTNEVDAKFETCVR